MLDGVSLDQLRAFIAAVDEGSFSAAGRKLYRVQSAVSGWISGLEAQLDVVLFDRTARFPKLTPEGELLLADARSVVSGVDAMKARAKLMAGGLEAELSVVVDVFFPTATIAAAAKAFAERFPLTPLRLFVEGMGAAYQPVLDERCSLGILTSLPIEFPSLVSERVVEIPFVIVAAPQHPLAKFRGRIPTREIAKHVQLVLTDRSNLLAGKDFGVFSPSTWRLADLSTKYAFLKDGVGWGSMPRHMVESDIAVGSLVLLNVREDFALTMSAFYRASAPPGPAGRWFIDHLKGLSVDVPESREPDDLPASQKTARTSRRPPHRA
ncbi:LysR family transcriptional regulator [Halomonas cupida]|uniref:DNA-binding transcriptional regulator, LysR family n=1 Tax=Halomonas cupida TaxID=44933 RepID=A0A1M7ET09_9GAMM|nr:LysR family transcriptional regulator [Halomonas cupida]GEN23238.1 LysR family transcriptional regulator [Halomonas cupida]SHL94619.1 DNA-binding transcriptional regulator, LysR family [Halomonas cupida]